MNRLARPFGFLVSVLLAATTSFAQGQVKKADIRGPITKATKNDSKSALGSILVEGQREKDTRYDKALITILRTTTIEKLVGANRVPATIDDLTAGVRVEATFTGPVAESYPVQARAATVLILPADDKK